MLKKLNALVIEPDLSARMRLREALGAVALKTDVAHCRGTNELADAVSRNSPFDVIFVSSTFPENTITEFLTKVKSYSACARTVFVLTLKRDDQDCSFIAPYLLKGFHGFICEPFSVDHLVSLIQNSRDAKEAGIEKPHTRRVLFEFLVGDAIRHLDRLAFHRATEGEHGGGYAFRELKDVSAQMRSLEKELGEQLPNLLVKKFESVPTPKPIPQHLKVKKTVITHPGSEVRELLMRRSISVDHLVQCLKMPEETVRSLLDGEIAITEHIAQGLAHNLGNTPAYWLSAQRRYDRAHKKNPDAKGKSDEA